jgi:hypothetical protein
MSLKQWKYTNGYEPYETLPEVNSEDNGKVLGVSSGQYALVNGGGGSVGLVVNETFSGSIGTLDKTYAEIKAAFASGGSVVIITDQSDGEYTTLKINSVIGVEENGYQDDISYIVSTYTLTYGASAPDAYPNVSYE